MLVSPKLGNFHFFRTGFLSLASVPPSSARGVLTTATNPVIGTVPCSKLAAKLRTPDETNGGHRESEVSEIFYMHIQEI